MRSNTRRVGNNFNYIHIIDNNTIHIVKLQHHQQERYQQHIM